MEAELITYLFEKESYEKHAAWYNKHFPEKADKLSFYSLQNMPTENTIANWLQCCFFDCLNPLLNNDRLDWLTVGDAYGFDAQYLISKGMYACATDLNFDFLEVANEIGVVTDYAIQNAEQLTYPDGAFDYILCKESYHHFPRPYAALYEMIRVARKGMVIIEPHDPIAKMPLLLFLVNITKFWSSINRRIWKNRFSFEPVGNFIYKVSEREFEKFAAGLKLPALAFKYINPNFYHPDNKGLKASFTNKYFLLLRLKKLLLDLCLKLKLIPGQVLSTIVFKEAPNQDLIKKLKEEGYKITIIPKNPFL